MYGTAAHSFISVESTWYTFVVEFIYIYEVKMHFHIIINITFVNSLLFSKNEINIKVTNKSNKNLGKILSVDGRSDKLWKNEKTNILYLKYVGGN